MSIRRRARAAERRVVRDDDERDAARVQYLQQPYDLVAGGAIEVAGRLVGEDQRRLHHGGARDRDALPLAAGKLIRPVVRAICQAVLVECLRNARARSDGVMPASIIGSAMFSAADRRGTR